MKSTSRQLQFLPEFQKFITASSNGRRLMPSGKRLRRGTITQYNCVFSLLQEFEDLLDEPLRIALLHRSSLRTLQKEKNYWSRFFKNFSAFLYKKEYYDQYVGSIFKVIKTFFHYLNVERAYPVGDFHKKFRIPVSNFTPAIISPSQLRFLITDREFEKTLTKWLLRAKDIFVFGCTVGLRFQDLMRLKKDNIQYAPEGIFVLLHTQKTGAEVKIPLPEYAEGIINKYRRKAGRFILPRLSGTNLNIQLKKLAKKAGWDYYVGNNPILRFDPNGMEWDENAKKELPGIYAKIDSKVSGIEKDISKVSKSDKDADGNAIYNKEEEEKVKALNDRKDNLISAKSEIERMDADQNFVFSLNAKKGIITGGISADPTNLKNVTITFRKGDFGNQLHEMKHGFQLIVKYMTLNADGTASVANLNNGKLLEVQAYERQLSYTGVIDFSLSPQTGDKNFEINNLTGLTGTKNQINTPFSATKFDHITQALISRMMKSAIGNEKSYPEY